jgi:hypothetical protein
MNKTLFNLYIKTTKEDKTNMYAILMSGEIQLNKTKNVCNTHIRYIQPNKTCRNNEKCVISLLFFVIHVYIDIVHIC